MCKLQKRLWLSVVDVFYYNVPLRYNRFCHQPCVIKRSGGKNLPSYIYFFFLLNSPLKIHHVLGQLEPYFRRFMYSGALVLNCREELSGEINNYSRSLTPGSWSISYFPLVLISYVSLLLNLFVNPVAPLLIQAQRSLSILLDL